ASYLATLQLGAIYLLLNTAYTNSELQYFVDDAEPRVMLVAPSRVSQTQLLLPNLTVRQLDRNGRGTLLQSADRLEAVEFVEASDAAAILYTSGTTGRSKGAVLTHENLATNCLALLDTWEFDEKDRLIHALPIFHIHGLFV